MIKNFRKTMFLIYAMFLRLPMWAFIWLVGRTGIIKTIFVIYPHDQKEYSNLCPNYKFFLNFLSGRPTPGGLILDGWKPVGIYLFISNTPQELIKKKNRHIAEAIVRRMKWIQKISGATACGFAGQLGPILERRHGIAMDPPFFGSTMGNVFSIDDSISFLAKKINRPHWQLSIAIIGGGELGEMLLEHFQSQGYQADIIEVLYKRRSGVEISDLQVTDRQLEHADFVVNLLATGDEFLECGIANLLSPSTTVIDFSRPPIPKEKLQSQVFMGNRIQRSGMRFVFALPGWEQEELPACSIPSILASNFGIVEQKPSIFCAAARQVAFETALTPSILPVRNSLKTQLNTMGARLYTYCRFLFDPIKERPVPQKDVIR